MYYYVYVLESLSRNMMYVGRTKNVEKRLKEHKEGKTWSTKRMLPVKLIYFEAFISKEDAIRRERYLKTSKGKSTLKLMLRESLK